MQITESGLKKPESQDIEPIQSNVDILDEHLRDTDIHVNAAKIAEIEIPEELSQIDSADTNSTMWGKIKKSISELINHVDKVASETTLGHIKIGTGIQMEDDVAHVKIANDLETSDPNTALSADMGVKLNNKIKEHEEKVASETVLGHIKIGTGLQVTDGVASVNLGALIDKIYPIGSVYISVNNISPAEFLEGIWERFAAGRTLIGIDGSNQNYQTPEMIGGNETISLDIKNMPSHTHSFSATSKPSGTASTSVSIAADGYHYHLAGALTADKASITGKLGNMITESKGGLLASGVFSCGPSAEHGRYGGGTELSTLNDISYLDASHPHTISGNTEWSGTHAHGASATTSLAFNNMTVSGNTGASGNGQAFSNLQPYITSYMWKRVG